MYSGSKHEGILEFIFLLNVQISYLVQNTCKCLYLINHNDVYINEEADDMA